MQPLPFSYYYIAVLMEMSSSPQLAATAAYSTFRFTSTCFCFRTPLLPHRESQVLAPAPPRQTKSSSSGRRQETRRIKRGQPPEDQTSQKAKISRRRRRQNKSLFFPAYTSCCIRKRRMFVSSSPFLIQWRPKKGLWPLLFCDLLEFSGGQANKMGRIWKAKIDKMKPLELEGFNYLAIPSTYVVQQASIFLIFQCNYQIFYINQYAKCSKCAQNGFVSDLG